METSQKQKLARYKCRPVFHSAPGERIDDRSVPKRSRMLLGTPRHLLHSRAVATSHSPPLGPPCGDRLPQRFHPNSSELALDGGKELPFLESDMPLEQIAELHGRLGSS